MTRLSCCYNNMQTLDILCRTTTQHTKIRLRLQAALAYDITASAKRSLMYFPTIPVHSGPSAVPAGVVFKEYVDLARYPARGEPTTNEWRLWFLGGSCLRRRKLLKPKFVQLFTPSANEEFVLVQKQAACHLRALENQQPFFPPGNAPALRISEQPVLSTFDRHH